ncbi:MAG: aminopeptidase P N-terminal domain-containing protein, partial [Burkholderiales bacterium]|nr:aminopeptidase P N-terminal domain-containing protein [Burkholderiales bacterium]
MNTMTETRVYRDRRDMLANILAETYGGGVAVIPNAPEVIRNHTTFYPYRSESNFYYLTGFSEPESVLVLLVNAQGKSRHFLFCRDKNPLRETWEGERVGFKAARDAFLFDQTFFIEKLGARLSKFMV